MSGLSEFDRAPHRRARGGVGEEAAVAWLEGAGLRVVGRNVRNHGGEIDIVAEERGTLCFIEVKARASARFGPAVAAVGLRKQRRIARAAALYLVSRPWRGECRFDVLGLDRDGQGDWSFTFVRGAFEAPFSA